MAKSDDESTAETAAVPTLNALTKRLFDAMEEFRKKELNTGPAVMDLSGDGRWSLQLNVASARRAAALVGSLAVDLVPKHESVLVSVRCGNQADTEGFPLKTLNADRVARWLEQRLEDMVPQAGRRAT